VVTTGFARLEDGALVRVSTPEEADPEKMAVPLSDDNKPRGQRRGGNRGNGQNRPPQRDNAGQHQPAAQPGAPAHPAPAPPGASGSAEPAASGEPAAPQPDAKTSADTKSSADASR
jgi:multidrug efflux system membrane fusion protein